MGTYLNEGNRLYGESVNSEIHVDKSLLIRETNKRLRTHDKYICLSRPRRFGKSMAAHMLMAYYSRGADSRELFRDKKIYSDPSFEKHLNKYNVIHLTMTKYKRIAVSEMISSILENVFFDIDEEVRDLRRTVPDFADKELIFRKKESLVNVLEDFYRYTKIPYVFIIDEWDAPMRENMGDENKQNEYLDFLRDLLKDQEYVALAYATGILPVRYMPQISMFRTFVENDDGSLSFYNGDFDWSSILRARNDSEKCLKAILSGDAETVAALVERSHQENTSLIKYNDENSLACVVAIALYYARNRYFTFRELPSGKGYADIVFLPRPGEALPAIVIELKAEASPSIAIDQIKRREYPAALEGYSGEIVLVGINYRTDPAHPEYKKHTCVIERM